MTNNLSFISTNQLDYNELLIDKYQRNFEVNEGFIQTLIFKVKPHPGFTIKQNNGPPILEKYCNLCDHLAIQPIKCSGCYLFYCQKCAQLLTLLKQETKQHVNNLLDQRNLIGKQFNCIFNDCHNQQYFESIDLEQTNELNLVKVNCIYSNCDENNYYQYMLDHIITCKAGPDFRIDPNLIENFDSDEDEVEPTSNEFVEKLVKVLDASIENDKTKRVWTDKLTKSFNDLSLRLNNIDINSSVKTVVDLVIQKPKPQFKKIQMVHYKVDREPAIPSYIEPVNEQQNFSRITLNKQNKNLSQNKNIATMRNHECNEQVNSKRSIDDDWGSDAYCKDKLNDDIEKAKLLANDFNKKRKLIHCYYQNDRLKNSVSNEQRSNVESATKKVKSIIIVPEQTIEPETNHVFTIELKNYHPVGSRVEPKKTANDFKSRSKKLAWKYRQRNTEKVNQKTEMRAMKTYLKRKTELCQQHLTKLGPPKHFAELISRNVIQLGKDGLNACALDIECVEIENEEEDGSIKIKLVPCWVAIINSNGEVTLNEFIRYPQRSIRRMLQSFHGLTWKEIQYAPSFYKVRVQVIEEIKKYKRIVVCNQTVDFAHLMINVKDHRYLLPRIVDITSYYNCRSNADSIALKYIVFVMFGKIFQAKHHSPLLDAAYTMYLYLIDYHRIEMIMKKISINCTPIRLYHDFRGYIYPPNELFCGLLKDIMKQIKDWPLNIKINVNTKKEIQEKDAIKKSYSQMKLCDHIEEPRPTPYKYVEGKFRFFCHPSTRK